MRDEGCRDGGLRCGRHGWTLTLVAGDGGMRLGGEGGGLRNDCSEDDGGGEGEKRLVTEMRMEMVLAVVCDKNREQ